MAPERGTIVTRPARRSTLAALILAVALPGASAGQSAPDGTDLPVLVRNYYRAFWRDMPAVARRAWSECLNDGRVNLVGVAYRPGLNCRIVIVDGYPRRFVVHVPPTLSTATPAPVVLMHHGSGGSGEQFHNISGWVEEADARGFVAVFPTAMEYVDLDTGRWTTKWHDFNLPEKVDLALRPPGYPEDAPWPAQDTAFVSLILYDLEAHLPVGADSRRLYASGFSSGGAFAARLAVELSDRLAAVAAFAGGLTGVHAPIARIPIVYGFGTEDEGRIQTANAMLLPGQDPIESLPLDPRELLSLVSIRVSVEAFTDTFGLERSPNGAVSAEHHTRIRWTTPVDGNQDGNVFGLIVLEGVPHHYPHLDSPRSKNPHGFSAARIFWRFFDRYAKP